MSVVKFSDVFLCGTYVCGMWGWIDAQQKKRPPKVVLLLGCTLYWFKILLPKYTGSKTCYLLPELGLHDYTHTRCQHLYRLDLYFLFRRKKVQIVCINLHHWQRHILSFQMHFSPYSIVRVQSYAHAVAFWRC